MDELFKKLVDLAGYGLPGLAIASILVLGYLAIKRPNNKFGIIIVFIFCLAIITLFTFAGVGVAKENKEVTSKNQNLTNDNKQLSEEKKDLSDKVKIQDAKLDIVKFQSLVVNNNVLPQDSISKVADSLSNKFEFLASKDTGTKKVEWTNLAKDYKEISGRLKTNAFTPNEAVMEIKNSNYRIYDKLTNQ